MASTTDGMRSDTLCFLLTALSRRRVHRTNRCLRTRSLSILPQQHAISVSCPLKVPARGWTPFHQRRLHPLLLSPGMTNLAATMAPRHCGKRSDWPRRRLMSPATSLRNTNSNSNRAIKAEGAPSSSGSCSTPCPARRTPCGGPPRRCSSCTTTLSAPSRLRAQQRKSRSPTRHAGSNRSRRRPASAHAGSHRASTPRQPPSAASRNSSLNS